MTIHCDRCGCRIAPGELRYRLVIELTADFDGVITPENSPADDASMDRLLAAIETADAGELERQVHEMLRFILCPRCRVWLSSDPLRRNETGTREPPAWEVENG
ncbi:hypothetical protein JW905_01255 [bacterium]|nr:hypothetical protein [candidate division CSSED10-310 bacterium]